MFHVCSLVVFDGRQFSQYGNFFFFVEVTKMLKQKKQKKHSPFMRVSSMTDVQKFVSVNKAIQLMDMLD